MAPRPIDPSELDVALALVVAAQADPATASAAVGSEAEGIRAELDDLDPPWTETGRVVGAVDGLSTVDWDVEVGRAYVNVWAADDEAALALFDAAVAQAPAGLTMVEVGVDAANERMFRVAATRGLTPGPVNHALVADRAVAAGWGPDPEGVRPAGPDDVDAVAALHDAEFPLAYLPVTRFLDDDRVTVVAGGGYATGEVLADGTAFVDYVAVPPAARRTGLGRALLVGLARRLLVDADTVALTVVETNTAALALYDALGFRLDARLVALRGPMPQV